MKVFFIILIIAAFLQTSFIPINLCLVIIICRSLVVSDSKNLYVAFGIGILVGILSVRNIGFWPLLFVLVVKFTEVLRKLPFSSNGFTIIPYTGVLVSLVALVEGLFFHQTINPLKLVAETFIAVPFYLFFRFWEDRFIVQRDIKLKITR